METSQFAERKTLREKEKLLISINFSFSLKVFHKSLFVEFHIVSTKIIDWYQSANYSLVSVRKIEYFNREKT